MDNRCTIIMENPKSKIQNPKLKFNQGKDAAFTLIELLVVVAIIALLISILLPSLNQAKGLARRVVCMSNLKQVGYAIIMYANDYDGALPSRFYLGIYRWFELIPPYLIEERTQMFVLDCPSKEGCLVDGSGLVWGDYAGNANLGSCKMYGVSEPAKRAYIFDGAYVQTGWWGYEDDPATSRFDMRHLDGGNVLYLDIHVAWRNTYFTQDEVDPSVP